MKADSFEHAALRVDDGAIGHGVDRFAVYPAALGIRKHSAENSRPLHKLALGSRKPIAAAEITLNFVNQFSGFSIGRCPAVKIVERQKPQFSSGFRGWIEVASGSNLAFSAGIFSAT